MKKEKNTNDLSLHISECIDKNIKKQSQFPLEILALADVCLLCRVAGKMLPELIMSEMQIQKQMQEQKKNQNNN